MNQNVSENILNVIEVPPELRGPSDEEIIRNSERFKKDFAGKRKNGAARPSKRDRILQKKEKDLIEVQKIAAEIFGTTPKRNDYFPHLDPVSEVPALNTLPPEKQKMLQSAFTPNSKGYTVIKATEEKSAHEAPHSMISEPPKPTSGRVLKASFGAKTGDKPRAVIVNAADLAKQKAEERAKKIQDFFRAKHPEATAMPDGAPIKRGRGRPRKNPIV